MNFSPEATADARFNVCIDPATIDTGIDKRDKHLRSEDFFDVGTYPRICFVSSEVRQSGSGFITKGKLTMHGVTKEVEIPFTFKDETLNGTLLLLRKDYNVGEGYSNVLAGDEVTIEIVCRLQ